MLAVGGGEKLFLDISKYTHLLEKRRAPQKLFKLLIETLLLIAELDVPVPFLVTIQTIS